MALRFTDSTGVWRQVRSHAPFPVAGGQVLEWLNDDFNGVLEPDEWEVVSGTPVPFNSELTISNGIVLLSRKSFRPPCLVEVVGCMTARASTDDFRVGFYRDDNNLVEWGASGTNASKMDARMVAGGIASHQTGIYVGASNNTYRLASIYLGLGEAVWAYRAINTQSVRNEVYRVIEHDIPEGNFRVRLAGLAGTSTMKVGRVTAYQLADIVPPGALGHHVDSMAVPVRLTNGPFVASPTNTALGYLQRISETFSALAVGAVGTGVTRSFYTEQSHVQAYFMGDQPFSWWVEARADGTNWQVVAHGTSVDATTDAVVRYYAASPVLRLSGSSGIRVKVKNSGAAAGTFRGTLIAAVL